MRAIGLLCALLLATPAMARIVEGRVQLDANGNGRADPGEPGIADVKLGNGRELVRSDRKGRYRIELRAGDTLLLIKPPGYRALRDARGLPKIAQLEFPKGSPQRLRYGGVAPVRADGRFLLQRAEASKQPLDVLVFADPQPKSEADVDYYARDIVAPLQGRHVAQLGLSLGDIVSDRLDLYPAMNAVTARLGIPWLHVPGNHDIDFDASNDERSMDSFRAVYGADNFVWEEPAAVFIGLDDVIYQPGQVPSYIGGLREDQFRFLQAYLATLAPDTRIVLGVHIHFFDAIPGRESFRHADRERLFALLRPFRRVLLLSGHAHAQRHVMHGPDSGWHGEQPLHEYNVGAACGGYWGGTFDAEGIPESTMADGTPNGYASLRIDASGDYSLRWHVARDEQDPGLRVHAPRVLRRGAWPGVPLVANVYMGMPDSVVELRIDGGEWRPMRYSVEPDPYVVAENLRDDEAAQRRGYDRLVQAEPSTHLWRYHLPTDLAAGEHQVEVRSIDRWRGELRTALRYRLEEAP